MLNKMMRALALLSMITTVSIASTAYTPAMEVHTQVENQIPEEVVEIRERIVEQEPIISQEEIDLIALVTMAEAEGESEEGKRLVIDTILNRVDHEKFPNTIEEVIYQPHQFTSMTNGRVNKCHVTDEISQLVEEELVTRTNDEVIFFTAGEYGKYGKPLFSIGNHYFSSYD